MVFVTGTEKKLTQTLRTLRLLRAKPSIKQAFVDLNFPVSGDLLQEPF